MIHYSVRLFGPAFTTLALARVVSLEAGQVANDVAAAELECRPVRGVTLDDVQAYSVTRHEAGRVTPIGVYLVQSTTERVDGRRVTWRLGGASPVCLYQQRLGPNLATALNVSAAWTIARLFDSALARGDTPLTVEATRADTASPCATTQTGVLEPLSTAQALAKAAEAVYGMDIRRKVCFDAPILDSATGLTLRPAVWVGEYGADRRLGSGVQPVLLHLSKVVDGWEATNDRAKQVTRVVGTGEASSYSNPTALQNPVGNRREKTASGSSTGASRVNAQSRATLYEGRPVTRLEASLSGPPFRWGLALGDVCSVLLNGTLGTGRLNVIHWAWGADGEKVAGRLDVEIGTWQT